VSRTVESPHTGLLRVLGRWDLTSLGVNQVIGGAIFAVPASLAAQAGTWSPWLVIAVGLASLLVAISFAEVASRFDATGGPYLYARVAFGRFAGFEVGWMAWITRVASLASILNVLATSLGFYWPALTAGIPRTVLIVLAVAVITAINLRGIRQSSLVVNLFTIGKLAPLVAFIVIGLWYIEPVRLAPSGTVPFPELAAASLLLVFAFGGYENVPIPAGEASDPRRAMPFALVATIVVVTAIFALIQVVALGTFPGLAASRTPLADSAAVFMGAGGAAMLTAGAVVSMAGNNLGGAVAGSRILFALAEQGDIPGVFARIHARYRTPFTSILTTSGVTLLLAVSGTFMVLAQVSAISRLVGYLATCAATLHLRRPAFQGVVAPATFVAPLGPVIPLSAIVIALTILAGATQANLVAGAIALVVGGILYWVTTTSTPKPQLPTPKGR
jgi:basic amino acid/polyamine antiporter, APA family